MERNAAIAQWQHRCQELLAKGGEQTRVFQACYAAAIATVKRSNGDKSVYISPDFEKLPPIYGRNGKSPPSKKRFCKKLFGSSNFKKPPIWTTN
jgi:hypothetical protein